MPGLVILSFKGKKGHKIDKNQMMAHMNKI